jgi:iron(III)-enterobactin esterase
VFSKFNCGGKWKLSGSLGGFDAGARRTAPEGGRAPQRLLENAPGGVLIFVGQNADGGLLSYQQLSHFMKTLTMTKFICAGIGLGVALVSLPLFADIDDNGNFNIGPDYTNAVETIARSDVPHGTLHVFTMNSQDSKLYPGIAKNQSGIVPYKRRVCVYVPSQYKAGTPAPLIVVQDGMGYTNLLPVVLDNMIADHRLPAMVAVMINSGGGDAQGSERGLEYDTVSEKYADFVETEVLPRITKDYGVTFTTDPDGRATMGCSSGAAAAFTMAWFRPDLYHRVLSYSGTYVNQQSPTNPASLHGAWEYHEHLIRQNDMKPLRVWLQVGEQDLGYQRAEGTLHNWVLANRHMAEALKAKGYPYRFTFALGAQHCDGRVRRATLPDALAWLWQGYPAQ